MWSRRAALDCGTGLLVLEVGGEAQRHERPSVSQVQSLMCEGPDTLSRGLGGPNYIHDNIEVPFPFSQCSPLHRWCRRTQAMTPVTSSPPSAHITKFQTPAYLTMALMKRTDINCIEYQSLDTDLFTTLQDEIASTQCKALCSLKYNGRIKEKHVQLSELCIG